MSLAPEHFQLLYQWDRWFDQALTGAIQAEYQAIQRPLMRELSFRRSLESEKLALAFFYKNRDVINPSPLALLKGYISDTVEDLHIEETYGFSATLSSSSDSPLSDHRFVFIQSLLPSLIYTKLLTQKECLSYIIEAVKKGGIGY